MLVLDVFVKLCTVRAGINRPSWPQNCQKQYTRIVQLSQGPCIHCDIGKKEFLNFIRV